MELSLEKLKKLLIEPGHISETSFDVAVKEAKVKKKDVADILIEKNLKGLTLIRFSF